MVWVARRWIICLDELNGWLRAAMASDYGGGGSGREVFNTAVVSNSGTNRRLCLAMACGQNSQQNV